MTGSTQSVSNKFRILSLEGGGIMGAFTASVLSSFEEQTGYRCADYFDLIVGTSTGGIIAIGLGMGLPAAHIQKFYEEEGPIVFRNAGITRRFLNTIRHLFQPKYSQTILRDALAKAFTNPITGVSPKFGEAKCRLVIPTYDAVSGRLYLMKTAHHPRFTYDINASVVDVALATAAAPTYFSAVQFPTHGPGASYIDGGVWANCPALVGIVEAASFLDTPLNSIDVLNIGTTSTPFSASKNAQAGLFGWAQGLINVLMGAQVETSRAMTSLLTGGGIFHVDYIAPNDMYSLDDSTKIAELVSLGRGEAVKKQILETVKHRFLTGVPVAPFKPFVSVT